MSRENFKTELYKTMIAKHGSIKAWKEHMRDIGRAGGKKGGGIGGFKDKKLAQRAGRLGGIARHHKHVFVMKELGIKQCDCGEIKE